MNSETATSRRIAYIGISIAILIIAWHIPNPAGLTHEGSMALALLIAGIFLWVTEPLPMPISALGLMTLLPVLGILPVKDVWLGFISSVIFFIMASFGITTALLKTKLSAKIVFLLLRLSKGNSRLTILAFMLASAFVSFFISDLPCVALFSGIAVSSVLEVEKTEKKKSNLGKGLMIGVVYGSVIGGQCLPTGSSLNIMAMGMLEANTGIAISFLEWAAICTPLALAMLFVSWLVLTAMFKPEPISKSTINIIEHKATQVGRLEVLDIKVMAIMVITLGLWVASNWTGWDPTAIAVGSMLVFFIPGIDVLKWEEYVKGVAWNIILLTGGVQALAAGIQKQGTAKWLFDLSVGKLAIGPGIVVAAAAVFLPVLRLIIPVGPAFIAICLIPLSAIAGVVGASPVVFTVIVAVNASTTYLLGIDNASMLSYRYGYWTMGQYFRVGIAPTLAMMVLHAFALAPLVAAAGL